MQDDKDQDEKQSRRRGRLWIWFVIGFLLVFVCTSVTVTMYPMRPSGDALVACKLWKYYVIEIRRALSSTNAVGPASGSFSAMVMTTFQHLLCSVAGGAGMVAIGWGFRKVKGR
jgi:hypothetical protein